MKHLGRTASLAPSALLAALLVSTGAGAEVYKCRSPEGRLSYQNSPCAAAAEGASLEIEAQRPKPSSKGSKQPDYSIESQARRMKAEREALSKKRQQARRQAERKANPPIGFDHDDALRCARSREALLKWQRQAQLSDPSLVDPIATQRQIERYEYEVNRYCY